MRGARRPCACSKALQAIMASTVRLESRQGPGCRSKARWSGEAHSAPPLSSSFGKLAEREAL
eukprot:1134278-Pyramimonas_sp.AAC.1